MRKKSSQVSKSNPAQNILGSIQDRINQAKSPQRLSAARRPAKQSADHEEQFLRQMENAIVHGPSRKKAPRFEINASPQVNESVLHSTDQSLPKVGTILYLDNGQVVVLEGAVAGQVQQCRLVLLENDGTLSHIQASLTEDYSEIGWIETKHQGQIFKAKTWSRDLIIFHLHKLRFLNLLANPAEDTSAPESRKQSVAGVKPDAKPIETETESGCDYDRLQRGQRFKIVYKKGQEWDAIFWGKTKHGPTVAHQSADHWVLVPMDLERYRDKIVALEILSYDQKKAILRSLKIFKP